MNKEQTYIIPVAVYDALLKRIEKLNRKASKLNCLPVSVTILNETVISEPVAPEFIGIIEPKTYKCYRVKINGQAPIINGWKLVARIEFLPNGNILKKVDESIDLTQYRDVKPLCQHCNTIRNRINTYVVLNIKTLETKQVGSDCLKDFIGHVSPESIASYYENLLALLDELGEVNDNPHEFAQGKGFETVNLFEFLCLVYTYVKKYGYVSKKNAFEENIAPTCEIVKNIYFIPETMKDFLSEIRLNREDIRILATKTVNDAIAWLLNEDPKNDYIHNLKVICGNEWVEVRHMNFACSLIPTYLKALYALKEKENKPVSQYQGSIKDKITVTLTVNKVITFNNQFGMSQLYLMTDANGNVFTWSTNNSCLNETETVNLIGTVKNHVDYKGVKQTVLTRCKIN